MTPIGYSARTSIIGTTWGIAYLFLLKNFMQAMWNFNLALYSHWQYFLRLWQKGWQVDTLYEWGFFITILFAIPVWLAGWAFFEEMPWEKWLGILNKQITPHGAKKEDKVEPSKDKEIENKASPAKHEEVLEDNSSNRPALMGSEVDFNRNASMIKSYANKTAKAPVQGGATAPTTQIAQTSATSVNLGEQIGEAVGKRISPAFDKLSSLLENSDKTRKSEHKEVMNKLENLVSSKSVSSATSASVASPKAPVAAPKRSPLTSPITGQNTQDITNILEAAGFEVLENVLVGENKIDYAALSRDNIVIMNVDNEKGEWLADEDMIGDNPPLWFSETNHRVSPVYQLEQVREELKNMLPDNLREIDINPVLVINEGTIINADEMLEVWPKKSVFVVRHNQGGPVIIDDILDVLAPGSETKPEGDNFTSFKEVFSA